ncbi:anti-Muellerian hormone type-2 receptor isoform X1 [Xenopus tropicalis]|uniref:receptor protein serine/threonine kinase n=1 Tax=Xenopus tropicalis TaxID=8364 RepID=A0A8J1J8R3_XENTR|nr:anti-Muellerian hormone type-2 receptor isoform X1 [Xenopus tropicalis]
MGMSHGELLLGFLLLSSALTLPVVHLEGITCALYENSSSSVSFPVSNFGELQEPGKIYCKESNCCVGLWSLFSGELQPLILGCYPKNAVCRSALCNPVRIQSQYHCFCSSDNCNANITLPQQPISPAQAELEGCAHWNVSCDWMEAAREQPRNASSFSDYTYVYVATIFLILCVLCVIIIVLRKRIHTDLFIRRRGEEQELQTVIKEERNTPPTTQVDGLTILQALKEDSLSVQLSLGNFHGRNVVIKCFPPALREQYKQEYRILSLLTSLHHKNIVCLIKAGSSSFLKEHYLLVLQHYPRGSLRSYLIHCTTNWTTACQMATSLAKGLAFLHADIWKEDVYKPPIAHRDLSSENILVTADSLCVISDFGLSVVLEGQKIMKRNTEDPAISMTGTLRYMSPEMLDGSLNLVLWELALTQADVYSLGLLLWEIFSRCYDLYADQCAPEFQVVFLEELGPNPTLHELQSLIVENKRRPQLPKSWGNNIKLVGALWETLEDCWDPDSEARLTAQCAEERLSNLCNPQC